MRGLPLWTHDSARRAGRATVETREHVQAERDLVSVHVERRRQPDQLSGCVPGSKSAMLNSATAVPRYPEIVRVDLRCAACKHDWTLYTRHADPPI